MTNVHPGIVGQHIQPLKNNYFKAWKVTTMNSMNAFAGEAQYGQRS